MQSKKSSPRTKRSDPTEKPSEVEVIASAANTTESAQKQKKTVAAPVSKVKAAAQSHRTGKTTVKPEEVATTVVAAPKSEVPVAEMPVASHEPPKTMAAAAGSRSSFAVPVTAVRPEITHSSISDRAYYLWAERGFQGGSPDEDWVRAERELRSKS